MRTRALLIAALLMAAAIVFAWARRVPHRPDAADGRAGAPRAIGDIASRAIAGKRVIFIGLDGADWSLLDQYMARGVMPELAKLVETGASGSLKTLQPPLSPLVWTTMLTGTSTQRMTKLRNASFLIRSGRTVHAAKSRALTDSQIAG